MADIVVDTSVVLAVVLNEPEKKRLIDLTENTELFAPHSLHWEVGNAFSAMFKRGRLSLQEALTGVREYGKIPIRFVDIDLAESLKIADKEGIYAYDAYMLSCAKRYHCPLLTLDRSLERTAIKTGIPVLEV